MSFDALRASLAQTLSRDEGEVRAATEQLMAWHKEAGFCCALWVSVERCCHHNSLVLVIVVGGGVVCECETRLSPSVSRQAIVSDVAACAADGDGDWLRVAAVIQLRVSRPFVALVGAAHA